ncbi:hypothetical protein ACFVJM_35795 [Streptomyces virginiae]|uniref:hypothetical protein n=1 Tax=Streptomyces virginiae TaxID=1961 RepID=UPI003645D9E2
MADAWLSRSCKKVLAGVCVLLLYGISACKGGSTDAGLRKLATSESTATARDAAEKELRAKAAAVQAHYPWLTLVRVQLVDDCIRGAPPNPIDPNPPTRMKLVCVMRLHLYFAPGVPVPTVVERVTAVGGPTAWTPASVRDALTFYETAGYENPRSYQPRMASATGESLSWDAPKPGALLEEQCSGPRPVYRRCLSEPSRQPLTALREEHGPLFVWTLTSSYLSVEAGS